MLAAGLRGAARGALQAAGRPFNLPGPPSQLRGFRLSAARETVIVERWWQVPLSKEGRPPRIKHRRYRVFRLVEDLKHVPKPPLELILTHCVEDVGNRGDLVSVHPSFGRNILLAENKAVYASPENKKIFEEEKRLRAEGKLPRLQSHSAIKTVRFLQNCSLEIGVNDCDQFELTNEIVAHQFYRNLGVVVSLHALKLPDEPITQLGDYWCDVTVNGLDTIRVPISVVRSATPMPESERLWLARPEPQATPEQPW
ncbi:large ribosomal subunit protein bL9m [Pogona vitticeps]